jgi:hypothetical protein
LENAEGEKIYDPELMTAVEGLFRIILAQDAEMWLISINEQHLDEFITLQKQMETNLQELADIKEKAKNTKVNKVLRQETVQHHAHSFQSNPCGTEGNDSILAHIMLPSTRSMVKRTMTNVNHIANSSRGQSASHH